MGTELAKYDEAWAKAGQEFASKEKESGAFLSLAGGVFKMGDEPIPGNQICAVIIDSVFENAYYAEKWTPDGPVMPPTCFAMAHEQEDLEPMLDAMMADQDYFEPQNDTCQGCPMNEWGSIDTGKGKACGNRRRLALIQAGEYVPTRGVRNAFEVEPFEDEEHYQFADLVFLKLPVTSGKEYSKFVKATLREYGRPPYGVVTRIYIEHGGANQFTVKFEALDVLPDDWFGTIQGRHEDARQAIIQPYNPPDKEDRAASRGNGRLAGLKKKQ